MALPAIDAMAEADRDDDPIAHDESLHGFEAAAGPAGWRAAKTLSSAAALPTA
jgi:hypothetical protein